MPTVKNLKIVIGTKKINLRCKNLKKTNFKKLKNNCAKMNKREKFSILSTKKK